MSGAVGTAYAGAITEYVSKRAPGQGWQTVATTPHPDSTNFTVYSGTTAMIPSTGFSRFLFTSQLAYVKDEPKHEYGTQGTSGVNIFLGEDPAVEPAWLGEPQIAEPIPSSGDVEYTQYQITGASPSLETVYFAYQGTLVPEDSSRAPHTGLGAKGEDVPWGFYEWNAGRLVAAGMLPNGQFSPFGAVPAGLAASGSTSRGDAGSQANGMDNQVSADGTRAFFVSPDPIASEVTDQASCENTPPCSTEAPQLYVREPTSGGGHVSVLISGSQLSSHEGEAAPDGVVSFANTPVERRDGTYAFAAPDGSQVYFASVDRLTQAAPENGEAKMYDYDLETAQLTYMPQLTGPIAFASPDGSTLLFENRESTPWQLELWHAGASGGELTSIAELPGSGINLDAVHMSSDGDVLVFRSNAEIPGFNDAGGFDQIYRYDTEGEVLDCLSCPPAGAAPEGNARMSYNNDETGVKNNGASSDPMTTIETRGMSEDGDRVFFDTPASLVPQDTNGQRDVYEWADGTIYLISSGSSDEPSEYLDSDAAGENVFFATAAGLVPGDADGAPDVYDARIPRPGDNAPPAQVPCKGAICQGPPGVPQLLSPPASETFAGVGNLAPKAEPKSKQKMKHKKRHKAKPKRKRGVKTHATRNAGNVRSKRTERRHDRRGK
ncbi:MAG TPA: hypothetical protein VGF95_15480 [Solirubrobacteraceae bacterium]